MPVTLTANAIAAINAGNVDLKPLVQVLEIRSIGKPQERFRLVISDGVSSQHAMLAVQLNDRVKSGEVDKGSIVRLIDYLCSDVKGRRLTIVLNMETIVPRSDTIGNPTMSAESDPQHSTNKAPPPPIPSSYRSHGPIMKNDAPARIIPIAALNPYQGRWAIKARVTAKGDIRRYNNAKGDGKVFSFDLLDSDGGEIRITCFNALVDRFCHVVEVGKVYLISRGSLKPAQRNFNHLKNEWEVFLESASTVELCPDEDDDGSIPRQQFNFRSIGEVAEAENNAVVDIIGVVTFVSPCVTILRKNGMETQRRTLSLKDDSGKAVEVTLWGEFCNRDGRILEEMVAVGNPVLAIKAGKVSDFSGKSVGTISSTQLFINPDFPEAQKLREWFDDHGGKDTASSSISRDNMPTGLMRNEIRKVVSQIKEEGLGRSDKPDWVTVKATVAFIKTDTFCYTACPLMIGGDKQCNKKVTRTGTNMWLCDRCNQEFEECDYRYLLQVQIQDHTGMAWVTAFQESGEEIMGCPAKQLYTLKHELQNDEEFAVIVRNRLFHQYMLKLKIKEETYGEEQRLKMTVVKVDKVNYTSESRYLLNLLLGSPQV